MMAKIKIDLVKRRDADISPGASGPNRPILSPTDNSLKFNIVYPDTILIYHLQRFLSIDRNST
jgi:hypothetical protein